jgi:Acetyltransferase (GNAT) domain
MAAARDIEVRLLREAEHGEWDRFASTAPSGSIYSRTDYLEILCRAAGGSFRVLAAFCKGTLAGGVALYETPSRFGSCVSSRLLLYYNGLVLAERASLHIAVQTALAEALETQGYARVRLSNRGAVPDVRAFLARGWTAFPEYTYVVPLADPGELWRRVDRNLRRLVQRCREAGVTAAADGDVEAFHRMHAEVHERKGAPLYLPRERFVRYVEELLRKDLARLYLARLPDGRPAAGQLVLRGHPVSHTVCAAAHEELLSLGTTPFLRWRAFEELATLGHAANDLTDAALNPVTRFKSQLGGDLELRLVLTRPDAPALRAAEAARRAALRGRSLLGRAWRGLRREGRQDRNAEEGPA